MARTDRQYILNDGLGSVWYTPGYLSPEKQQTLFDQLKTSVAWEQPTVKLWGSTYRPRRGIYAMADEGVIPYSFAGDRVVPHPWLPAVQEIREALASDLQIEGLNFALLNFYYDGESKLGYHQDDEHDMEPHTPIVGVVLGEGRDFLIRAKSAEAKEKHKNVIKTFIGAGDVFTMEGATQKHFQHSVPCRKRAGPRISITFRRMKQK